VGVALTGLAMAEREIRWPIGLLVLVAWGGALAIVRAKRQFLLASLLIAISIRTTVNLWTPEERPYVVSSGTTTTAVELLALDPPLLGLALLLWATKRREHRPTDVVEVLAVLFLLLTAVSALQAEDLSLSLCRFPVVARLLLIYYCFSRGVRSRRDVRLCVLALAACGIAQSCLAIVQTAGASPGVVGALVEREEQLSIIAVGSEEYGRATGTVGYTTVLAQYLGAVFPMTVAAIFLARKAFWRNVAFGGSCLVVAAILLILSRAEWIITPLSLTAMSWLGAGKFRSVRRFSRGRLAAMLLALVTVVALFWPMVAGRLTGPDEDSAASRIPSARVAVAVIAAHPFWGVGLNNYTRDMTAHGSQALLPGSPFGAHNTFLYLAAESGVLTLFVLLALLVATVRRLLSVRRADEGSLALPAVAVLCGLGALLAHSMVEEGLHVHQVLAAILWTYVGLAGALLNLQKDDAIHASRRVPGP